MHAQSALRSELQNRFNEFRVKNPSYSLRSFARKLDVSPAALSRILAGKRGISKKMAKQFAERLCFSPEKTEAILSAFPAKRRYKDDTADSTATLQLTLDQFKVVSEWYHFAIRALLRTNGANDSPQWIAKKLNITKTQAITALERLHRLGLLEKNVRGAYVPTEANYFSPDGAPSSAIRNNHAQHLELANASLERDGVDQRDFTNLTMAIDPEHLPEARALIRKFRKQMSKLMEPGSKKQVYSLCVQLFPLSKDEL